MHSTIVIRPAEVRDAAAIAKVHIDSWKTTYSGIIPTEKLDKLNYAEREQVWSKTLSKEPPTDFNFVADVNSHVIGFISGGLEREPNTPFTGELYAIYLLADHQRQGIGKLLIAELLKTLLAHKLNSMRTWVLEKNPSRNFYEKLGGILGDEKKVKIAGVELIELSYGWNQIQPLLNQLL